MAKYIIWASRTSSAFERIDTASSIKEAKQLVKEYKAAYGKGWHIWYASKPA